MKFYATFKNKCYSFNDKKLREYFVQKSNALFGENSSIALTRAQALKKFGYTDSCSRRVIEETNLSSKEPIFKFFKDCEVPV